MRRLTFIWLLCAGAVLISPSSARALIIDAAPGVFINFRGTTNAAVTLRVEIMTTPLAGGAPVAAGVYDIPIPFGANAAAHAAMVAAVLGADPNLIVGAVGPVNGTTNPAIWSRASIQSATGVRVGIRVISASAAPLPPAMGIPLYNMGAWPPFPAGGVAFNTKTVDQTGQFGVNFGILGTHIYANPPALRADDGPSIFISKQTTVGSPAIPTVSEWGLIVMTLLLLTAGTVVLRRRRRLAAA